MNVHEDILHTSLRIHKKNKAILENDVEKLCPQVVFTDRVFGAIGPI